MPGGWPTRARCTRAPAPSSTRRPSTTYAEQAGEGGGRMRAFSDPNLRLSDADILGMLTDASSPFAPRRGEFDPAVRPEELDADGIAGRGDLSADGTLRRRADAVPVPGDARGRASPAARPTTAGSPISATSEPEAPRGRRADRRRGHRRHGEGDPRGEGDGPVGRRAAADQYRCASLLPPPALRAAVGRLRGARHAAALALGLVAGLRRRRPAPRRCSSARSTCGPSGRSRRCCGRVSSSGIRS